MHAFNLANDLGAVGALLDRHPNVQIDFAARMWELARQPFTARRFFLKYEDRILFGTDNDPVLAMYLAHVRQMETEDEWFWPADAEWWRGYGMGLPDGVLKKVYSAERREAPRPPPLIQGSTAEGGQRRVNSSRKNTTPAFITKPTRSLTVMSGRGRGDRDEVGQPFAFWPWGITEASVPRPIERPAASASLKDWSWRSRSLRPRSRSDSGTFGSLGMNWLMYSVGT